MTSKIISSNQRNTSEYVSFKHKSMNQSILWLFRMFCWIPTGVIQENIWVLWTFSGLRWLHCIFKSHVGTLVWIREEAGQQNWGSLRSCSAGSFKYAGAKKLYKKRILKNSFWGGLTKRSLMLFALSSSTCTTGGASREAHQSDACRALKQTPSANPDLQHKHQINRNLSVQQITFNAKPHENKEKPREGHRKRVSSFTSAASESGCLH